MDNNMLLDTFAVQIAHDHRVYRYTFAGVATNGAFVVRISVSVARIDKRHVMK